MWNKNITTGMTRRAKRNEKPSETGRRGEAYTVVLLRMTACLRSANLIFHLWV